VLERDQAQEMIGLRPNEEGDRDRRIRVGHESAAHRGPVELHAKAFDPWRDAPAFGVAADQVDRLRPGVSVARGRLVRRERSDEIGKRRREIEQPDDPEARQGNLVLAELEPEQSPLTSDEDRLLVREGSGSGQWREGDGRAH